MMAFTRMRFARLSRGIRQVDVAHAARLQPARLSLIETGRVAPRADELARLGAVLDVSPDDLMGEVRTVV